MTRITFLLLLIVMALAACSGDSSSDSQGFATDGTTSVVGSTSEPESDSAISDPTDPTVFISGDDDGFGRQIVIQLEYQGAGREFTYNELVDLIVLERYLADRSGETYDLETAVFTVLEQIQSSVMAVLIAPDNGVTVDSELVTARVRTHLGLDENGQQSAGDPEFDERFDGLLKTVGITESLYEEYVRNSLFLEALQAKIESQGAGTDFQQFLDEARSQFNLKIDLDSNNFDWFTEQIELRVQSLISTQ